MRKLGKFTRKAGGPAVEASTGVRRGKAALLLGLPALLLAAAFGLQAPVSQAAGPSGQPSGRLYVPSPSADTVQVVDVGTHKVINTVKTGKNPILLVKSIDQKTVYIDNLELATSHIQALNVASNALTDIPVSGVPAIIKPSPDGKSLYVGELNKKVEVLDTATNKVVKTFTYSAIPFSVELSPDGNTMYLAFLDGTAGIYDAHTGTALKPVVNLGTGSIPAYIGLSLDGTKVYTANGGTHSVTVIDAKTWSILTTIDMGTGNVPVAAFNTPDGKQVYVNNFKGTSGSLTVIDVATSTVAKVIPAPGPPTSVNFTADGKHAFVVSGGADARGLLLNLVGMFLPPSPRAGPGEVLDFDPATATFTANGPAVAPSPGLGVLIES